MKKIILIISILIISIIPIVLISLFRVDYEYKMFGERCTFSTAYESPVTNSYYPMSKIGKFEIHQNENGFLTQIIHTSKYDDTLSLTKMDIRDTVLLKITSIDRHSRLIEEDKYKLEYYNDTTILYVSSSGETIKEINGTQVDLEQGYDLQSQMVKHLDILKLFEKFCTDNAKEVIDNFQIDTLKYLEYPEGYRIKYDKNYWKECLVTITIGYKDYYILANRGFYGKWLKYRKFRWSN